MLQQLIIKQEKFLLLTGAFIFLLFAALTAFTNNYFLILVPFGLLFAGWLILNWKSAYWFFIFCIPISFEFSIFNNRLSTTIPDEQVMWAFLLLFAFMFFGRKHLFPEWFLRNPITLVLALQFVWLIVAVMFSENIYLSGKYFLSQTWFAVSYIIFPIFIFRDKKDFKKAFILFSIPFILHVIVVFCWHYTLHFGYWASNIVVRPLYMNHVDYSTMLSMYFPLLLIAFQLCKGYRTKRVVLLLIIIFFIPAILVAGARAAMLAVAFALFINMAIRKRFVNWVMPVMYAIIITCVFLLAKDNRYYKLRPDMKYTATQATFAETVTAMFSGNDMSSMERFYRWIACVRMSNERPLTGVGPNNFYDYYKAYTVTAFQTWVSRNEERSTTHNYFLLMLVEQGWPAMLLYAILIMVMFAQAQKMYHNIKDPFYKKVTMGLIMVLAAGFVNNFFSELITTHKVGFMFYVPLVLLVVVKHLSEKEENNGLGITSV